jgi:oxygen-independent coproporphyrinogen-3 oxidase
MGIQTLDGGVLDTVRREQTRRQALDACDLLAASGLLVNVDLIYGLPGQTEETFLDDLLVLAERGVHSLTLYSLRLNERTPVVRHLRAEERFDLASLMRWRALAQRAAQQLGYTQTRWHTFKRLDTRARAHERLPCFDARMSGFQFGVGMSARSHLGFTIYRNHEQLDVYLDRIERGESPVEQVFRLDEEDRMTQFIARTLGDGKALVRSDYARTFGRSIDDDFGGLLKRLAEAELVIDDGEQLTLSASGGLVYDLVTLAFYPQRARDWLAARGGWAESAGTEAIAS